MVERMAGPERISAHALSQEVGISQPTLSRWLREAPRRSAMNSKKSSSNSKSGSARRGRSALDKLRLVVEAESLKGEALGAFLRREGLYEADLKAWRETASESLARPSKRKKSSPEAKRIRELERDLRRKEKALAEVTALLALKKKVAEILGDGDDDTGTRSGT